MSGPWKGMRYPPNLHGGNAVHAKLLGMYEKELDPVFKTLADRPFVTVIDIGSAEGFYVVGCALRYPNAKVIGFEVSDACRESLHELAKLNGGASRVSVRGFCDASALATAMQEVAGELLVIADVEAAEAALLDPDSVPALKHATIIVETHDFAVPGESALLTEIRSYPCHCHPSSSEPERDRSAILLSAIFATLVSPCGF